MLAASSCFRQDLSNKQPKKHDMIVVCILDSILSFLKKMLHMYVWYNI